MKCPECGHPNCKLLKIVPKGYIYFLCLNCRAIFKKHEEKDYEPNSADR